MSNVQKTLQMTSLLFGMAVLFCYIAWSLGYDGFIIVGNIILPRWLEQTIPPILLCINLSLWAGFTLNMYSWKVLYFSIPLSLLSAIGAQFISAEIFTGLVPTVVFAVAILFKKLGKSGFMRLIISNGVILVYQWLVSRFSGLDLDVYVGIYQMFRLSINSIIFMLLLYSIGGEKYYANQDSKLVGNGSAWKRLEHLVFPGRIRDNRAGDESRQANQKSTRDIPVGKFEVWVMRSVIAAVQILQWMFILWVCNLDNLFLDALVMTTSFICHGMIIAKRKHFKPIILCTLAATAMFYFAARFTISFQYSHFFPILVGLLLAYTVYRISYQFEKAAQENIIVDLERVKKLEAQMSEAWKRLDKLS